MEYYAYCVYDPEIEAFDARINLAPLEPKEIAEQYRRTAIKLNEAQKAEAEGKKVFWIGMFDDITGVFTQKKHQCIFEFHSKQQKEVNPEEEEASA